MKKNTEIILPRTTLHSNEDCVLFHMRFLFNMHVSID